MQRPVMGQEYVCPRALREESFLVQHECEGPRIDAVCVALGKEMGKARPILASLLEALRRMFRYREVMTDLPSV